MKITQEVRDYAATQPIEVEKDATRLVESRMLSEEEILQAMNAKSEEFNAQGANLYTPVSSHTEKAD
jgi:hypothetical protein